MRTLGKQRSPRPTRRWRGWLTQIVAIVSLSLMACQAPLMGVDGTPYRFTEPSRDGIGKVYQGREIAQVMGHEGAYWLERPSRELQEQPQRLVDLLRLPTDAQVAEIGAGTGYISARLAAQVPEGVVWAVDIQPEMVEFLDQRRVEDGVSNLHPVLGTTTDPQLAPNSLDMVLMVDAYHELEYPYEVMTHAIAALKPGGQLVLAEYRAENPLILIKRLHKMSEAQVKREITPLGLDWLKTDESLPQQHLLFFEKRTGAALEVTREATPGVADNAVEPLSQVSPDLVKTEGLGV